MSNLYNSSLKSQYSLHDKRGRLFQNGGGVLVLVGFWEAAPTVFIAIICLHFLLLVTGIVLNGLVCYVMIKSKRYLKNISCFFITHMAAVDLSGRVVFTPLVVYLTLPTQEVQSPIPCKISAFVAHSCAAAIFGSLVVIAIDRYRNIIHPLRSFTKEKRPLLFAVSLVWFYAIASSAMFLHTAQNVPLDELPEGVHLNLVGNPTTCNISPDFVGSVSVTISFIMTFFIPLTILIITYSAIFLSLHRRCKKQLIHNAVAKCKAKAARMLVLVVVGFVLCFGPSVVLQLLRTYKVFTDQYGQSPTIVILVLVTDTLEYCSSLFNPLIYTFFSEDFRRELQSTCSTNTALLRRKIHICNRKVADTSPRSLQAGSAHVTTIL